MEYASDVNRTFDGYSNVLYSSRTQERKKKALLTSKSNTIERLITYKRD